MPARKPSPPPPASLLAEKPVIALIGKDAFLRQELLDAIISELSTDLQRSDVDGESADAREVFDELRSIAMFGGSRLVVVRQGEEFITGNRESLERFLEGITPDGLGGNRLVLHCTTLPANQRVYKLINKVGAAVPCEPPAEKALPAWIRERARSRHALQMTADAVNLLADLAGNDPGLIDNELAKLALVERSGPVAPEEIAGSVAFRREQQMWTLTDALSTATPAAALATWRQISATDPSAEFRAVTWLAIWLERAVAALRLERKGEKPFAIARQLKIWPAEAVGPLLARADRLGPTGLRAAADDLAEADYRIKTGLGEAGQVVERFIANVCAS